MCGIFAVFGVKTQGSGVEERKARCGVATPGKAPRLPPPLARRWQLLALHDTVAPLRTDKKGVSSCGAHGAEALALVRRVDKGERPHGPLRSCVRHGARDRALRALYVLGRRCPDPGATRVGC